MVLLGRLIGTLWNIFSRTQLRLLAVEGATRLCMRGAGMIRNEIFMYRAYQARKLAAASQPKSLKLVTPQKSHLLFQGNPGILDSSTSEAGFLRSWSRRWAFVGVTAAQLAVALRWPLEEPEEEMDEEDAEEIGNIGLAVKRAVPLDDLLASAALVSEPWDPALEFWENFAEDLHP